MSSLESLPVDLVLNIFRYLDDVDIGRCSSVNKRFYLIASDEMVWKNLLRQLIHQSGAEWDVESINHTNIEYDEHNWTEAASSALQEIESDTVEYCSSSSSSTSTSTNSSTEETPLILTKFKNMKAMEAKKSWIPRISSWKRTYLYLKYEWVVPVAPQVQYGPITCWESNFSNIVCSTPYGKHNIIQFILDCMVLLFTVFLVFIKKETDAYQNSASSSGFRWSWWTAFSPIIIWAFIGNFMTLSAFRQALQMTILAACCLLCVKLESLPPHPVIYHDNETVLPWTLVFSPLWIAALLIIFRIGVDCSRIDEEFYRMNYQNKTKWLPDRCKLSQFRSLLLLPTVILLALFVILLGLKLDQSLFSFEGFIASNTAWYIVFSPLAIWNIATLICIPVTLVVRRCQKSNGFRPLEWWWRKRNRWNTQVFMIVLYFIQFPAVFLEVISVIDFRSNLEPISMESISPKRFYLYVALISVSVFSLLCGSFLYRPQYLLNESDFIHQHKRRILSGEHQEGWHEYSLKSSPHFIRFTSFKGFIRWPKRNGYVSMWWSTTMLLSVIVLIKIQGQYAWDWWLIFLPYILVVNFIAVMLFRTRDICLSMITFLLFDGFLFQLAWSLSTNWETAFSPSPSSNSGSNLLMDGPLSYVYPTCAMLSMVLVVFFLKVFPIRLRFCVVYLLISFFLAITLAWVQQRKYIDITPAAPFVLLWGLQLCFIVLVASYFIWYESSFKWHSFEFKAASKQLSRIHSLFVLVLWDILVLSIAELGVYKTMTEPKAPWWLSAAVISSELLAIFTFALVYDNGRETDENNDYNDQDHIGIQVYHD